MTDPRRGSALVLAIWMLALAGLAAALLAELGRTALGRARLERDGVRAWFLAEARLAETVAALAPGTDFDAALAGSMPDTAAAWTTAVAFADDDDETPADPTRDANQRVWLRVTAVGPAPIRRRLEALLGRASDPYLPGAATASGDVRELTEDFSLDGRDFDMESGCTVLSGDSARAGLALPEDAALPSALPSDQIVGRGGSPSLALVPAPDLRPLADRPEATRHAPGPLAGELGSVAAPRFTVVDGDGFVDDGVVGAGILYATGRLRVGGRLDFTGLVAAAGGVEVTSGGRLGVCGALWGAGAAALDLRGAGAVRASAEAIRVAQGLTPLPAQARVIATREIF